MKTLLLNVFEGCSNPENYKKLVSHIQKQAPDILGLNELNNWEKNNFEKLNHFLQYTNFPYHVFCKSRSGFNMALFSKYPVADHKILTTGFRTGAVIADLKAQKDMFTVALTHLHYKNESLRLKELKLLLGALTTKRNVILMGDLNSLSPHDGYKEKELLAKMRNKGITKFGTRKLHMSVINKLLTDNYLDAVKHMSKKPQYSVPTEANEDRDHLLRLRLDYIFVSRDLEKHLKQAEIMRNKQTNAISDHFPVLARLSA